MREPNRSRRRTRRASDHARREGGSCGKGQQWRFIVPPDFKTLGEREGSPSTPEPVWKGRSVCPCRAARGLTHNKCRTDRESRYKCPQHPRSGFHKGGTGLFGVRPARRRQQATTSRKRHASEQRRRRAGGASCRRSEAAPAGSTKAPAASEPSRYPRRRGWVVCSRSGRSSGNIPLPWGTQLHFFDVPVVSGLRAALSWAGRPIYVRGA